MISNQKLSIFTTFILSLTTVLILINCSPAHAAQDVKSQEELISVKGKVKGFANPNQSKTISIVVKEKGVMVFKYTDTTEFVNFKQLPELSGESAVIKYRTSGSDNVASEIIKAFVKLPKGVGELKVEEMAALIKKGPEAGNYFSIDARPAKRYEEGHIRGALSIPVPKLKKEGAKLLPLDKNMPLIFYCGGPTCGMSPKAAGMAQKWGYTNIRVFLQGEPGWKKAGYYTTSTPGYIKTANVILIDLRSRKAVKAGHIPGAISIPAEELTKVRDKFPSYKGAHIVFYSDNEKDINEAVRTGRKWGYKKTTVYLGGVNAWKQSGYKLAKGPAAKDIKYVRKISPGEISIADFTKAIESDTAVIVDVRTPTEHAAGHINGVVNIPVDDMAIRHAELSKEKTILTHCITGVRAEMAYTILKERGYKVKFLMAEPVFNPDGTYEITE